MKNNQDRTTTKAVNKRFIPMKARKENRILEDEIEESCKTIGDNIKIAAMEALKERK